MKVLVTGGTSLIGAGVAIGEALAQRSAPAAVRATGAALWGGSIAGTLLVV